MGRIGELWRRYCRDVLRRAFEVCGCCKLTFLFWTQLQICPVGVCHRHQKRIRMLIGWFLLCESIVSFAPLANILATLHKQKDHSVYTALTHVSLATRHCTSLGSRTQQKKILFSFLGECGGYSIFVYDDAWPSCITHSHPTSRVHVVWRAILSPRTVCTGVDFLK